MHSLKRLERRPQLFFNQRAFRNTFRSVVDKYSESAHFIYELLQNADDVGATYVDIILAKEYLVFKHNGKEKFSITPEYEDETKKLGHINSITGVASSSKGLEDQKIGKFGVGFKAVFQYTHEPHIYDDKFWFKIVDYVVPEEIEHDYKDRNNNETLFYIPFFNPPKAFNDIMTRLKRLDNPILFLNNLKIIRWRFAESTNIFEYRKKETIVSTLKGVTMSDITITNCNVKKDLIMFSSRVNLNNHGEHIIKLGYYLDDKGDIDTEVRPNVFCFFPTQEKFGDACFICHAPFLLVDSRQQIKDSEEVNHLLVSHLAKLQAQSLILLRDRSKQSKKILLNENLFSIVPLANIFYNAEEDSLNETNAFYLECLNVISKENLILSSAKTYLHTSDACLCTPVELMDLVKNDHLQELRDNKKLMFVARKISTLLEDTRISSFIGKLNLNRFSTKLLGELITEEFMVSQSIDWVVRLYKFLKRNASTLYEDNPGGDTPFRYAPIIPTSDGRFVPAYNDIGLLNVFFPVGNETKGYNFVSNEILLHKEALPFLEDLGIKEPNKLDYICNVILPKYSESKRIGKDELISDMDWILSYYESISEKEKEKLIGVLKDKHYKLKALDGQLYKPKSLHNSSPDILKIIAETNNKPLIDYGFYKDILEKYEISAISFINELGLLKSPFAKIKIHEETKSAYSIALPHKYQKMLKDVSNFTAFEFTDYSIPKLTDIFDKYFEKASTFPKHLSVELWNMLISFLDEGWYEGKFTYRYYGWYSPKRFDSELLSILKSSRWLLDGKLPEEVYQHELLESGYNYSDKMFTVLNIQRQEQSLKDLGASDTQIENEMFGRLLREEGISDISDLKDYFAYKRLKSQRISNNTSDSADSQEMNNNALPLHREHHTGVVAPESLPQEADFLTREEVSKVGLSDMFKYTPPAKLQDLENVIDDAEEIITDEEEIKQEIEEEKEKQHRIAELQTIVADSERYSKEWFEALLELEYKGSNTVDDSSNKSINISFRKVTKEVGSERIYVLRDSSRSIPLWLEEVGNIEVVFSFTNRDDTKIKFEVANVRDFSLRLKANHVFNEKLSLVNWDTCTKASISVPNRIDLANKLLIAFRSLGLPEGFNLKQDLTSNINFIFGPPGTGKTTTLAENIIRLMADKKRNQKILVLAPTNTACDELARKIIDKKKGTDYSWLARFVATSDEKLEDIVVERDSLIFNENKCCLISTMARLCFDGFERNRLSDIKWNLVICDEASMIPLGEMAYTIYNFKDTCPILIAGDPMQICPIVNREEWKDENIYSMVKLNRFDNPQTEPIQFKIVNLGTQYRSVPPIGELFSQYAYNGKLKHKRTIDEFPKYKFGKLSFKPINFIPFKVEKFDSIFGAKKLDGSNVHLYSVLLVVETCKYVAKKYAENYEKEFSIGIICPYAPQAKLIENLISQSSDIPNNVSITVGTIHRFQGGQCNMIFAVFNPPRGLKVASDRIFLNNKNIINVAISRAQDYLCILLPHCDTDGYNSLYELNKIGVISQMDSSNIQTYTCDEVEEIIFGKKFYIENNTFVTSHQMANVYSQPIKKYEIRIDESSVDFQLGSK